MKLSALAASAAADAVLALINAGSGPGILQIRTGAAPTNTTDADSGTLLAELTFSDPAFAAASGGVAAANAITGDPSANATGTAAHFRVKDSNGVVTMQGTVTASGGGGDLELVTTSIVATQPVEITAFSYAQPLT